MSWKRCPSIKSPLLSLQSHKTAKSSTSRQLFPESIFKGSHQLQQNRLTTAQMYVFPYKAAHMRDKLLSRLWREMLSRSFIPSLWILICAGCWRSQESTDKPCPQSYKSIRSKAEWDVHFKKQVPSSSGGECLCVGVDRMLVQEGFLRKVSKMKMGSRRDKEETRQ